MTDVFTHTLVVTVQTIENTTFETGHYTDVDDVTVLTTVVSHSHLTAGGLVDSGTIRHVRGGSAITVHPIMVGSATLTHYRF